MIRPGRDRLQGAIEADESYVGGLEEGVRGRQTESKALVAVVVEEDGQGIGRIRLRHISDASASNLIPFIQESVEPGSAIHTDGWLGYPSGTFQNQLLTCHSHNAARSAGDRESGRFRESGCSVPDKV